MVVELARSSSLANIIAEEPVGIAVKHKDCIAIVGHIPAKMRYSLHYTTRVVAVELLQIYN